MMSRLLVAAAAFAMASANGAEGQKWTRSLSGNGSGNGAGSGSGYEPEPEPELGNMSNMSCDNMTNMSNMSNCSNATEEIDLPDVVAAEIQIKMSEENVKAVVDAYNEEATKTGVEDAFRLSLAHVMEGIEKEDIVITSITMAEDAADDAGDRRLNATNVTNASAPTASLGGGGVEATLVVAFEIVAPEGTTGDSVAALVTGMDTAVFITEVTAKLKSEASLDVTVTSMAAPTAAVKPKPTKAPKKAVTVTSGAVTFAMPAVPLLLALVTGL